MTTGIAEDWYSLAIRAKWNDPAVQDRIVELLVRESEDQGTEDLDQVERAVFGERLHCPRGCGSMNLPGAPTCWGCEEALPVPDEGRGTP